MSSSWTEIMFASNQSRLGRPACLTWMLLVLLFRRLRGTPGADADAYSLRRHGPGRIREARAAAEALAGPSPLHHRSRAGAYLKRRLTYGSGRSASLAFGTTVVDLGANMTWEELVHLSRISERLKPVKLALREVKEFARTPDLPIPYAKRGDTVVEEPDSLERLERATNRFRQALVQSLELTPRKEVFIYVHGYHDSFQDAAFAWRSCGIIDEPADYSELPKAIEPAPSGYDAGGGFDAGSPMCVASGFAGSLFFAS